MKAAKTIMLALAAFAAGWAVRTAVTALFGDLHLLKPLNDTDMLASAALWIALLAVATALFTGKRVKYLVLCGGAFFVGMWMWVFSPGGERGEPLPVFGATLAQAATQLTDRIGTRIICVLLACGLCVLYLLYCRLSAKSATRRLTAFFLLATLLLGIPFMWFRAELSGRPLKQRVESETEVGCYAYAKTFPGEKNFIKNYLLYRDKLITERWPYIHAWSNMPGKTLLYFILLDLGMGSFEVALFTVVVCSLTAVPLFFIARRFFSPRLAAGAAVLYFFIPTIPLFLPSSNAMTPFFALAGLWLALWCLEKRLIEAGLICGIVLGLLFLYEPIPFVLAIFLIPWIYRSFREEPAKTLACFIAMAVGFAATAIGFTLLTKMPFLHITTETLRLGIKFNQIYQRGYVPYVFRNIEEFLVAIGSVTALLWVKGAGESIRQVFQKPVSPLRRIFSEPSSSGIFVFCFTLFIIILNFAGASRGEVDRLWIFLTPLTMMCALWAAERLNIRHIVPLTALWLFLEWLVRAGDKVPHWFF